MTGARKQGRPKVDRELDLQLEQAKAARQRAIKLELMNRKLRGELVSSRAVSDVWNAVLSNFRSRILQLPAKLMSVLEATSSKAEAMAVLDAGVKEALQELSEFDVSKVVDDVVEDDDAEDVPETGS